MPDWLYWAIWGCYGYHFVMAAILFSGLFQSYGNPYGRGLNTVLFSFPIVSAFWISYAIFG